MRVIFSKRMQSTLVMLFTLTFMVAMMIMIVGGLITRKHDPSAIIPLLSLFAFVGTIGWRAALHSRSAKWVLAYFGVQNALLLIIFWYENALTGGVGVFSGNLTVVLVIQAGVLSWSMRWIMVFGQLVLMLLIAGLFVPISSMLIIALVSLLLNSSIMLTGHLIVSEEEARNSADEARRKLSEYAAQAEELATMRERNRLAREIHDNLGHYLTIVNTQIEAARTVMASDPEHGAYLLERAQALTKEGLSEIRRSVSALRAAPIEQRPLPEAIQALIDEHASSGLVIGYKVNGQARPCSSTVEQAIYRAVQEGLTNVRKHARATRADVQLRYAAERIVLSICDNGIGGINPQPGFGLIGLQERMKLLNGVVHTEMSDDAGFTLRVEVPA
jgi:signal transduction histidine kinase